MSVEGNSNEPVVRCEVPVSAEGNVIVQPAFHPIVVRFADDDSGRSFSGWTNGRYWNGFACPHLPLDEFRRMLDVLLEWGDEQRYTVIDDQHVRVHGVTGVADEYVMTAQLQKTKYGEQWLFDCGGAWTFVEDEREADADETDRLVAEMAALPEYRGWRFSYEYPGFFCYSRSDNDYSVFCTPDWEGDETLPIEVQVDDGHVLSEHNARLPLPHAGRTGQQIFELVRPTLDKLLEVHVEVET